MIAKLWCFKFRGDRKFLLVYEECLQNWEIAKGVSLRASSNLAKLALLVWVSNFAFELQGKYRVVLFLD